MKDTHGEKSGWKRLFVAAKYNVRMRGGTDAFPTNVRIDKLLELSEEHGSVTVAQIADRLEISQITVE